MKKQALLCAVVSIILSPNVLADSNFRSSKALQRYAAEAQEVAVRLGQKSVADTQMESIKCDSAGQVKNSSMPGGKTTSPNSNNNSGAAVGG
jgi:hypothetical protein